MEVLIINDIREARLLINIKISKGQSVYGLVLVNPDNGYMGTNMEANKFAVFFDADDAEAYADYVEERT